MNHESVVCAEVPAKDNILEQYSGFIFAGGV
jgi:hypothetical protein